MKMTRKISAILISLTMIAVTFAFPGGAAFAREPAVIASGECGKNGGNLTWTLTDDCVITVSGEGEMADFGDVWVVDDEQTGIGHVESVPVPWIEALSGPILDKYGFESDDEVQQAIDDGTIGWYSHYQLKKDIASVKPKVVINENVTSIGANAFNSAFRVSECVLPSTLKSIGNFAFCGCGLTSVDLPEGLESIGERAFSYNELTEVTLPASLTRIDTTAFRDVDTLRTLTVLSDVDIRYLFIPAVDDGCPFTTYEDYRDFEKLSRYLDILSQLTCMDYYLDLSAPRYMVRYGMTEDEARAALLTEFSDSIEDVRAEYAVADDAAFDEIAAVLLSEINERLGTDMTVAELFDGLYQYVISPSLYVELCNAGLSDDLELLQGELYVALWMVTDYEDFLTYYMRQRQIGREEAEDELSSGLENLYAGLADRYGIEASSPQDVVDGVFAKISSDLGLTGENACTVGNSGRGYTVYINRSQQLYDALERAFGIEDAGFDEGFTSVELSLFEYTYGSVPAPWFTLRVRCDSANAGLPGQHGVGYELIHDTVPHEGRTPTCTEAGWAPYETCAKCDYTSYRDLPATGHPNARFCGETAATDAEHGHTEGVFCPDCGEWLSGEVIHNTLGEWTYLDEYTEDGNQKVIIVCTVCGESGLYEMVPVVPEPTEENGLIPTIEKALRSVIEFILRLIRWLQGIK